MMTATTTTTPRVMTKTVMTKIMIPATMRTVMMTLPAPPSLLRPHLRLRTLSPPLRPRLMSLLPPLRRPTPRRSTPRQPPPLRMSQPRLTRPPRLSLPRRVRPLPLFSRAESTCFVFCVNHFRLIDLLYHSATFFFQGGEAGACGTVHPDSAFIAALRKWKMLLKV